MNRLTFLLTLKDRPSYTRTWLQHNLRPEYDYFVADGSIGDENRLLFNEISLPNLTYVRYPKDLSVDCYVEKILHATRQIQTEYVMACDNDDFINYHGVTHCLDALEKDSRAVCAGGPIYGVIQNENNDTESRYSLPVKVIDAAGLHNRSGFDALVHLFKNYRYMWYSVFRAKSYQIIWSDIKQLQISNLYLIELLQAELTFCHGKYVHVKANHYIRLRNPITNASVEASSNDVPHSHKIYFDDEYRRQVLRMSGHVAKLIDVDLRQLLSALTEFYMSGIAQRSASFYSRICARLFRIHEILPRKLRIFFPIEFGIEFINIFSRDARR